MVLKESDDYCDGDVDGGEHDDERAEPVHVLGEDWDIGDEKSLFRVEIDDVKQFSDRIEYLLDNPGLGRIMGRRGRNWIKRNCSWNISVEKTMKFIERVVENA